MNATLHTTNGGMRVIDCDHVRLQPPHYPPDPGRLARLWRAIARRINFSPRTT